LIDIKNDFVAFPKVQQALMGTPPVIREIGFIAVVPDEPFAALKKTTGSPF
jgi:hypothetical protein